MKFSWITAAALGTIHRYELHLCNYNELAFVPRAIRVGRLDALATFTRRLEVLASTPYNMPVAVVGISVNPVRETGSSPPVLRTMPPAASFSGPVDLHKFVNRIVG